MVYIDFQDSQSLLIHVDFKSTYRRDTSEYLRSRILLDIMRARARCVIMIQNTQWPPPKTLRTIERNLQYQYQQYTFQ